MSLVHLGMGRLNNKQDCTELVKKLLHSFMDSWLKFSAFQWGVSMLALTHCHQHRSTEFFYLSHPNTACVCCCSSQFALLVALSLRELWSYMYPLPYDHCKFVARDELLRPQSLSPTGHSLYGGPLCLLKILMNVKEHLPTIAL